MLSVLLKTRGYFLGLLALGICLLFFEACRKVDSRSEIPQNNSSEKFFNSHRSSDPAEQALVNFVRNLDNKQPFISKVISQIGYPRWDKTFKRPKSRSGKAAADTIDYYYIPFVRDTQAYVNATMVIAASPSDTSLSYKCDWQYSEIYNSTSSVTDSAEHYAIFFMKMDKIVFGYEKFYITDSNLFRQNNRQATFIRFIDSTEAYGKGQLMAVETCADIQIFYTFENCPYRNHPTISTCWVTCDRCELCMVQGSMIIRSCWTEWVYETGGGTGTGSSGGGSGSGSPTYPPQCSGALAVKGSLYEGCVSGWNPDPTYPPDTYDYCAYINSLVTSPQFSGNLALMRTSCTGDREIARSFLNPLNPATYSEIPYTATGPGLAVDVILTAATDGVIHCHFNDPERVSTFSTDDMIMLARWFREGRVANPKTFTFTVVADNTAYIIMISNPQKFADWINANLVVNNQITVEKQALFRVMFEANGNGDPANGVQQESLFLQSMARYTDGMGLKVFRGNADMTSFTPIKLGRSGTNVVDGGCGMN